MEFLLALLFPLGQLFSPLFNKLLYSYHFSFYKKVNEDDVSERVGSEIYHESLPRISEAETLKRDILNLLHQDVPVPVLLVGKTGVGKTQLALDICRELDFRTLSPKPNKLEELSTSAWLRYGRKPGTVLLLDDLNNFVSRVGEGSSLNRIIEKIRRESGIVLATCRSDAYSQLVAAKLDSRHFHEVPIPEWSEEEGASLAHSLGKEFDPCEFDGTPICLTMGFGPQRKVYNQLDAGPRKVLHVAKLLYLGGLLSKARRPRVELLRKVYVEVLGAEDFGRALRQVCETGLLAQSPEGSFFSYEAVLERVVSDFPATESASWQLLEKVGKVLTAMRDSEGLLWVAVEAYLAGQQDLAITFNSLAIEIDPQLAEAYSNRGIARHAQEDHTGAIEDFTKAIEIDPQSAKAYSYRGIARHAQEDHTSAIEDFTKVIKIDPQSAKAYSNRGVARGGKEDHTGAIEDFTKAIKIDPQLAEAYSNRGVARGRQEDHTGAIEDFTKAIEIDPQSAKAYYNRGIARHAQEDHTGAVEDFTKAIEIDPSIAEERQSF
jgi:tetratricopeptide (TPR) repeat protein